MLAYLKHITYSVDYFCYCFTDYYCSGLSGNFQGAGVVSGNFRNPKFNENMPFHTKNMGIMPSFPLRFFFAFQRRERGHAPRPLGTRLYSVSHILLFYQHYYFSIVVCRLSILLFHLPYTIRLHQKCFVVICSYLFCVLCFRGVTVVGQ